MEKQSIDRFIKAQEESHLTVIKELKAGHKQSCWMWFTFPQIKGLGMSPISRYFEIQSPDELDKFVKNRYLAKNLRQCMKTLLALPTDDATEVFGPIDAVKLQSSLTLFGTTPKFKRISVRVLNKYFNGSIDRETIRILHKMKEWGD